MSRVPLVFAVVSVLVGLGAIGYVYGTDPVRRTMACAAPIEDSCVAREDLTIAETVAPLHRNVAAAATAVTTIDGVP